ncbi:MAG: carboxypeptidase regulatory-like domain-containing protein [Bdellovibrionia bacterium]
MITFLIAIFMMLTSSIAQAYVNTLTLKGTRVHWIQPFKLNLVGNVTNQSGLSPSQIWDAAVISLQRWKAASADAVGFDYWQGNSQSIYPSNNELNKISSLYFVSNSNPHVEIPSNVLGLTQVWYKVETGEILETDIALNDRNFIFTDNPRDTSGYGGEKTQLADGKLSVYLQNVIAHEIGHALGLSHSATLQSTMLFMESPEQAHLSCDELVGIHALYPGSDHPRRGSILGTVLTASGTPVLGAHILAISQQRGTVLAAALSDRAGKYRLDALEPGAYYLMVEPYYAGLQVLPSYYTEVTHSICNYGTGFDRTFSVKKADALQAEPIIVGENQITTPPTLVIHCGRTSTTLDSSNSIHSAKAVSFNSNSTAGSVPNSYFGISDKLGKNKINNYILPQISGHIEIHALAYSLYSPLHLSMHLISSDSTAINSQILDPVYVGDSGYKNYDSVLIAEDLPIGDYTLEVTGSPLSANDYPAGPVSLDSIPFILITGSLSSNQLPLETSLPNNSRCRNFDEKFPIYSSPSEFPSLGNSDAGHGTGFCGTQTDDPRDSRKNAQNHQESDLGSIVGWFLPWIFIFVFYRRQSRAQLSNRFSC